MSPATNDPLGPALDELLRGTGTGRRDVLGLVRRHARFIALNVGISFLRRNTRPVRQTVTLDEIDHELPHESTGSPELDERRRRFREHALAKRIPVYDELVEAADALRAVSFVERHRASA